MSNDEENPKVRASQKGPENPSSSEIQATWYSGFLQQASIYGIAAGYCISASLLSIINKWAVMKFPYPGALTALQYFTSAAGVVICGWFKIIEHDPLDRSTMWRFLPAAVIFYLSLFTNSELLLHANVDTFIVFRSAVPIFVAIERPLLETAMANDENLTFMAYSWALAYLISMSIDFVYIKHVVMTIGLNTWGLVLYNNLEALLLFPLELLIMGELKKIKHEISEESDCYLFLWVLLRRTISATGFTVLGIVNKLLTVVINLIIWDKHSTFVGTVGLLICMVGGILYQQSASNKPKAATDVKVQESQEEQQKLLEMQSNEKSNDGNELINSQEGK
ncbi:hypothetical protein AAG906_039305 [Vitis piasezkii]